MKQSLKSNGEKGGIQYKYDIEDDIEISFKQSKPNFYCQNCAHWESKTRDLIWGYEELAEVKEKQLQTLNKMINQLDDDLRKLKEKNEGLKERLHLSELQFQQLQTEHRQCSNLISYYKERQVTLLNQLKTAQNKLFTTTVQVEDQRDLKEQKSNKDITDVPHLKELNKNRTEPQLLPVIKSSQSLGKLLEKSLVEIDRLGRDKLVTELKHRIAALKAVQLSVLK